MHSVKIALFVALSSFLAACVPSGSSSAIPYSGNQPLVELEPNDDAAHADYLGEFLAGDVISVEGHVSECCDDPFDGFAFYALEPVRVAVTLHGYNPGADLDFALYLPEIDAVVDSWETSNNPEYGEFSFTGAGEFQIVVDSWIGDSGYLLDVEFLPLGQYLTNGPGMSSASLERFEDYRVRPQLPLGERRLVLPSTR